MAVLVTGGSGFVGLIMCSANLPDKIAIAVDTLFVPTPRMRLEVDGPPLADSAARRPPQA